MTPKEIEHAIGEIETGLDRLHALYNQYFMGIEKMQPLVQRKTLDRKIHELRKEKIRNTAQRFRLQTQIQKYNTQSIYWRRVCKEIEEGTYKRQIMLAKHRQSERLRREADAGGLGGDAPISVEIDLGALGLDEDLTVAIGFDEDLKAGLGKAIDEPGGLGLDEPFSNAPAPASRSSHAADPVDPEQKKALKSFFTKVKPPEEMMRPPDRKKPAELDAERVRKLYRTYLAAKKQCKESTDNLSMEKLASSLNKQFKAKGGSVDFKVVIRDGKTIIKTMKLEE